MRPVLSRGLALLALLAATWPADAHRAPGSLTTVACNERTGSTEVVHRLHLHDAELGVAAVLDEPSLTLSRLRSRALVALYVEERFRLRADGRELLLDTVGAEIEGDYLLVYQERAGCLPQRYEVRDDILRDAFPGQVNQVNIDTDGVVRTLSFRGDDRWQPFDAAAPLPPADAESE